MLNKLALFLWLSNKDYKIHDLTMRDPSLRISSPCVRTYFFIWKVSFFFKSCWINWKSMNNSVSMKQMIIVQYFYFVKRNFIYNVLDLVVFKLYKLHKIVIIVYIPYTIWYYQYLFLFYLVPCALVAPKMLELKCSSKICSV